LKLSPGDKVLITEEAWEAGDNGLLVATKGSIARVLSFDEFCGLLKTHNNNNLPEQINPEYVKLWMKERGDGYPIQFESIAESTWASQEYLTLAGCVAGRVEYMNINFCKIFCE
jgi:hypothetical protein